MISVFIYRSIPKDIKVIPLPVDIYKVPYVIFKFRSVFCITANKNILETEFIKEKRRKTGILFANAFAVTYKRVGAFTLLQRYIIAETSVK